MPGRTEPDEKGELNYPYIFERLRLINYQGWIGCEYKPRGWPIYVPWYRMSLTAFCSCGKKVIYFFHGCEKSCEGRPGCEATVFLPITTVYCDSTSTLFIRNECVSFLMRRVEEWLKHH